jgi:MOSC domain-containing protein YiiM
LDGDRQADLSVHDGEYTAVYCYPATPYDYRKRELAGRELSRARLGDNFITDGLLDSLHIN